MPFQPNNNDSDKLQYLLTVLKHTVIFKPNFAGVAEEVGLSRGDKARDKLKSQLANTGFVLLKEGRIAEIGFEDVPASPVKATPKKRTPKKKGAAESASKASASKKRKVEATEDGADGDDVVEGEDGITKETEA